jgi:hypothetical protein
LTRRGAERHAQTDFACSALLHRGADADAERDGDDDGRRARRAA